MKKQGSNTTKRTRLQKSFQQTVLKLYRKKNVDEITINEVCDKLGVPRSSFYYHYQTIRDVVSEIENDFLRVAKGALATIPFTGNEKTDYVNALATLIPIVKTTKTLSKPSPTKGTMPPSSANGPLSYQPHSPKSQPIVKESLPTLPYSESATTSTRAFLSLPSILMRFTKSHAEFTRSKPNSIRL